MIRVVNVTFAIDEMTHAFMKRHKEIKWTEVLRAALVKKTREIMQQEDPARAYMYKRIEDEGDDANELFA